jgi:hypothetical protein
VGCEICMIKTNPTSVVRPTYSHILGGFKRMTTISRLYIRVGFGYTCHVESSTSSYAFPSTKSITSNLKVEFASKGAGSPAHFRLWPFLLFE